MNNRSLFSRNVTLNDFFILMKHPLHPVHAKYSTFASEF